MKLSKKQRDELAAIEYFIPSWVEFEPVTDYDIERFFAWSFNEMPKDVAAYIAKRMDKPAIMECYKG